MFGAAKAHTLCPKIAGSLTINRRFGIGTDFEAANLVGPFHKRPEITRKFRLNGGHFARHDLSRGTIYCDHVAFDKPAPTDIENAVLGIDRKPASRSEEHTSELQSLIRISYAVFCLKKKKQQK